MSSCSSRVVIAVLLVSLVLFVLLFLYSGGSSSIPNKSQALGVFDKILKAKILPVVSQIVEEVAPMNNVPLDNVQYDKNFLYITQTEKCLRPHMAAVDGIGDPSDRDVLVLSYKTLCEDNSLPHVSYFFNSTATWTTGRSELYKAALRLDKKYRFYVVMDDDIIPTWKGGQGGNAWRGFEKILLDVEPPVAALDNEAWQLVNKIKNKRRATGCNESGPNPDYFLMRWFDGEFNAFHYTALQYVLKPIIPFWHHYDKASWWISQWYINFMSDFVFHGKSILLAHIFGTNPTHRNYPKGMHNLDILKGIIDDIRKVIPAEHKDQVEELVPSWLPSYVKILSTVEDTYCKPIPKPKQPLIPYSSFN